ncbi:APH(3'') family aminoglycoside O-phosphotransferase [Nocardioides soli]|uniref:Streptomycin 3'-kinase n=1 Tax=Nocardioides soli TaxID=1036020 RepID=A0A7W4VZF8_9ACTN|nr:APH(3'') family aminoglycoside O-phosphotransferase [Nocardioides soli]MBB3044530.1 streptomycin 3'-kinase [Nocardioides soli]
MSVNASIAVAALLPVDGSAWVPVETGESGATVLHDREGARFAKLVPVEESETLAAERDRISWLGEAGLPVASVLDWQATDDGACLVTRAVPGVPADRLDADMLRRAWPSIATMLRELHEVPVARCPFDRSLAVMMAVARRTVAEDRVQPEFLPDDLQRAAPAEILRRVEDELPRRRQEEDREHVVCHGDFCLPNILVDPETLGVSGLIDLGRLGRADPYADIALLLANARETWPDEGAARRADRDFAVRYGIDLDAGRQRFYLLLDPLTWPG